MFVRPALDVLREVQAVEQIDVRQALAFAWEAGIPLFESELRTLANADTLDDTRAMTRLLGELQPDARVLLDAIIARLIT